MAAAQAMPAKYDKQPARRLDALRTRDASPGKSERKQNYS